MGVRYVHQRALLARGGHEECAEGEDCAKYVGQSFHLRALLMVVVIGITKLTSAFVGPQ